MGLGDEIMITALAKKNRRNGWITEILDKNGNQRMHNIWHNNPNILGAKLDSLIADYEGIKGIKRLINHSGRRHYIDWTQSTPDKWIFQPWDIEPGEIFFDREEDFFRKAARPDTCDVLLDPGVKPGRENKFWGLGNWNTLGNLLHAANISWDVNNPNTSTDIRQWLADITRYKAIICHEGGLHHAAAALGIPCVVIFGGFISPSITGYDLPLHKNLTHAIEFCGLIRPCQHCREEMMAIKPEEVFEALQEVMKK